MDLNRLFEQFVGGIARDQAPSSQAPAHPAPSHEPPSQQTGTAGERGATGAGAAPTGLADLLSGLAEGRAGGFAGGLATGGLLGAVLGSKKMRKKVAKMGGGVVGYGGSAALGALALKAYQSWQAGQSAHVEQPGAAPRAVPPAVSERFDPAIARASDGQPMQLALIKAMIAAGNADGHLDRHEQEMVFKAMDAMTLDAEDKALVFDIIRNPPGIREIAALADGMEQASELYLASRLAIDPDEPVEQRYLGELAHALDLPPALVAQIEAQFAPAPQQRIADADMQPIGRDAGLPHASARTGGPVRFSGGDD